MPEETAKISRKDAKAQREEGLRSLVTDLLITDY